MGMGNTHLLNVLSFFLTQRKRRRTRHFRWLLAHDAHVIRPCKGIDSYSLTCRVHVAYADTFCSFRFVPSAITINKARIQAHAQAKMIRRRLRASLFPLVLLSEGANGFLAPSLSASNRQHSILKVATEEPSTVGVQDEAIADPASVVFYDDLLDPDNPGGVVCARGVCVLPDGAPIDWSAPPPSGADAADADESRPSKSIIDQFLNSYLGPRALLAFASVLYGTNFPLGAIMNENLPASAATSARMLMASLALSPFLFKLDPELAPTALVGGCFVAMGYITQSLSLVTCAPATVAFIGAATVVVCPALEFLVYKKDVSLRKAPQTWFAAALCLVGVGILELYDPTGQTATTDIFSQVGIGDFYALLQAVGFGTSFVLTEKMMTRVPGQALPITAVQVSVSAFISMIWAFSEGWIGTSGAESYGLPQMFLDPSLQTAAAAVAWTGFITTALNRFIETTALGKMSSAEASVILATEPLWAALFAALWLSEDFGADDYIGGALIVAACMATALKRENFNFLLGDDDKPASSTADVKKEDAYRP